MNARTNVIACIFISIILMSSVIAQPLNLRGNIVDQPIETIAQPVAGISAELAPVKSEVLKSETLVPEFNRLRASDEEIIAADAFLVNNGFSRQTKPENVWGLRETYRTTNQKGIRMLETYTLRVQDYGRLGSTDTAALAEDDAGAIAQGDMAAIAQVEVVSGGRSEVYSFALIAPEGDFENAEEYQVAETGEVLSVVAANSWWSCTKARVKDKCGSACLDALVSCPKSSWVAYLGCLAVKCGGCFLKAGACCGCNCKWWCKWATGCCHR
jgi:hypothetical protein